MNLTKIRIGSAVLYNYKTYMVVGTTLRKLQLIECDRFCSSFDRWTINNKIDKAIYARTSHCQAVPLMEVINNDHRFTPSIITLPDKTKVNGVTFANYDGRELITLIPDSKYVGTYRVMLRQSDYTGNNKAAYMVPITGLHELQNILNEVGLHITFSTVWK